MNTTYITTELIAQSQELIDRDRDYNFAASLPEGMALYSYSDGVWIVDTKYSCDMNDAIKIECVIAVNPVEVCFVAEVTTRKENAIGIFSNTTLYFKALIETRPDDLLKTAIAKARRIGMETYCVKSIKVW